MLYICYFKFELVKTFIAAKPRAIVNFKKANPIEAQGRFENASMQRVYWTDYDNKNISHPITYKNKYPTNKHFITNQSRATHPAWEYRGLEQNHLYPLLRNPQENTCIHFQNNLNTRLLERDNFKPTIQQFDINNN